MMNTVTNKTTRVFFASSNIWLSLITCFAIVLGTFYNIFSYFAFFLSIATVLLLSQEDSICFLMFIMPFANIFKSAPGAQSFFTYLLLFYVFWYLLKKKRINVAFLASFLVLCSFFLLQMFISINVLRTIKFVVNLLLIYLAINIKTKDENKKIYLFYIWGIVISSTVAVLNIIPNLSDYIGVKNLGQQYDGLARFSGLYADPNYYAINAIISLCLIIILSHKKQLHSALAILLAGAMIFFSIITFSKSAFLMLFLPLFLLFYTKIKSRKLFTLVILITIGTIFTASAFAGKIEILNIVISRLTEGSDMASITTGRSDIWIDYANYLSNNTSTLLLGAGFGGELVNGHAAHNTYIDLIYYLGLCGTIPLVLTIVSLFKSVKHFRKKNLLNMSVILSIIIMYFFLSEMFYFDWPFHVILAISTFKANLYKSKEK